ncbi:MAG: serine hydrolase [Gemmatimonadota bacterium]|nr:MAG: serine hydrolase [Gemmatimonadota bacterium]
MMYRRTCFQLLLIAATGFGLPERVSAQNPIVVDEERIAQVELLVEKYHQAGLFNGVALVAQNGKTLFEQGYGYANLEWQVPNGLDTRFDIASLSKGFTALAIMLLVQEGKIDLEAPISTYLPEYRRDIAESVTVHQLLDHTSCIPEETAYMLESKTADQVDSERLLRLINAQDPVLEPGTRFSYNNVGYILLSWIAESVSGVDFAQFLTERIFQPLGMSSTGVASRAVTAQQATGYTRLLGRYERPAIVDESWYRGAGGVYSTAGDLLAWDQALYEGALLSAELTERMFEPSQHADYGYGWSIRYYWEQGERRKIVSHEGGGPGAAAVIDRFLDDRILIVLLSNMRHSQVGTLSRQIGGIVLGAPPPPAPGKPIDDELQTILLDDGLRAARAFYEASAANPELRVPRSGSLNRIGYQFLRSGRIDDALEVFRLYTAIYPNIANAYDSFAEAQLVAGNRDSAIVYYRRAVDLDLDAVNALYMLDYLGDENPRRVTHPFLLAIIEKGDASVPAQYASMVAEGTAPGELYINSVGYNLLRHGQAEDALALFGFNVAAFPESANAWDSLGEGYMTVGAREQAIQAYHRSLELDPENRNAVRMLERLERG